VLAGEVIAVGNGGRLRGQGVAIAPQGVVAFDGGQVAPGVVQLAAGRASAATGTGVLTVQGNVTISETGELLLHLLGATTVEQDRLLVQGTAVVEGRLMLNFANGYAPQKDDEFTLIAADSLSGTPLEVVITGLEDGFAYDLDLRGGTLTLTALNDGISTTEPVAQAIYLPLVVR
jgi:uncharacterized protein with beta-barrel porin domain